MSGSSALKRGKVGAVPVEHAVQIGTDWLLVRLAGARTRKSVPKKDQASELLPKVGKALNKPGIDRSTVFGEPGNPRVYAYSACADEPGKIVRESVDGKKRLLGLLRGTFNYVYALVFARVQKEQDRHSLRH